MKKLHIIFASLACFFLLSSSLATARKFRGLLPLENTRFWWEKPSKILEGKTKRAHYPLFRRGPFVALSTQRSDLSVGSDSNEQSPATESGQGPSEVPSEPDDLPFIGPLLPHQQRTRTQHITPLPPECSNVNKYVNADVRSKYGGCLLVTGLTTSGTLLRGETRSDPAQDNLVISIIRKAGKDALREVFQADRPANTDGLRQHVRDDKESLRRLKDMGGSVETELRYPHFDPLALAALHGDSRYLRDVIDTLREEIWKEGSQQEEDHCIKTYLNGVEAKDPADIRSGD
uniref:Uncharacterized protein n=1 Tax=Chromera velia CCMP2878 TaxID=1169474 RepID=A0A0G4GF29_9ALVE|eukprot:Cvel_21519.t1-p1 / transcript=Cvel_21519.t1 / gene=Cvel_21519 / organism=Chromera_velia_CCMP2878 / gene_product=hypothetical protein / transcript_product=hypothetical protein / location=Cvel_scaffold2026:3413-6168(+) / protein_length=288 / sequence_SO=supercontig / SO=protein_coding / is_pseudo=false